jgi:STE24 endopeptidase
MNAYGVVILIALLVEWGLNLLADVMNLRGLCSEVPDEFRDTYDADNYRRSQEYTRARTRFDQVPGAANLVLLLGFWFVGGFAYLDGWVRGFGLGPIWTGLIFIGVLVCGYALLNLPFRVYSTFVIEARFGFNRTTPAVFVADMAKGLGLSVVLGGGGAVLLRTHRRARLAVLLDRNGLLCAGDAVHCADLDHAPLQQVQIARGW